MIDIVFSDSACGSLKMAQSFGKGEYLGGCTGVIISHSDGSKPTKEEIEAAEREAEKRARMAWRNAVPLGGNPADVYGLNLALSIGDISEEQPGVRRQQALERLFSVYPSEEGQAAARDIMQAVLRNLDAIQMRASAGEAIRVWYSNQPDDLCGLYLLMEQLRIWKAQDGELYLIKLPEWEAVGNNTIEHKISWGDVAPEEWRKYLDLQISAPPVFRMSCATIWRELQSENAPLRALLNGQLVSVPESIYDSFILREIEEEAEEFREAMVIGRVLHVANFYRYGYPIFNVYHVYFLDKLDSIFLFYVKQRKSLA